jgi:hypothetical protein
MGFKTRLFFLFGWMCLKSSGTDPAPTQGTIRIAPNLDADNEARRIAIGSASGCARAD